MCSIRIGQDFFKIWYIHDIVNCDIALNIDISLQSSSCTNKPIPIRSVVKPFWTSRTVATNYQLFIFPLHKLVASPKSLCATYAHSIASPENPSTNRKSWCYLRSVICKRVLLAVTQPSTYTDVVAKERRCLMPSTYIPIYSMYAAWTSNGAKATLRQPNWYKSGKDLKR